MIVPICPQCGNAFDGDRCLGCAPRKAEVDKTLYWSCIAAFLGMFLKLFAVLLYPLLGWSSQALGDVLGFWFVTVLSLMCSVRLARYITFVRAICVYSSTATFILAAFLFLNGVFDAHPPVEADALVSAKYVSHGRNPGPGLVVSMAWNQRQVEERFSVSRRTFSAVEPGDPVRITVHPGAFSTPWYSGGVMLNGTATSDSSPDKR